MTARARTLLPTRTPLVAALAALVLVAGAPAARSAGMGTGSRKTSKMLDGFYDAKREATAPDAFARSVALLRQVRVGDSEAMFFERMQAEVLARRGRPMDVRLDGFLPDATRRANRDSQGTRQIVLGFVEHGREVPQCRVVFVDNRVHEVVMPPSLAPPAEAAAPAADVAEAQPATECEPDDPFDR